jgi:hypothetical protein
LHGEKALGQATSFFTPLAGEFFEAFGFCAKVLRQLAATNVRANRSGQKQNQKGEAFA